MLVYMSCKGDSLLIKNFTNFFQNLWEVAASPQKFTWLYGVLYAVQGTVESMKWLTELMESSHSSLEVLPVPCLCEFLMASYKGQGEGGGSESDSAADPSSHRGMYKRRKTHDKVWGSLLRTLGGGGGGSVRIRGDFHCFNL